ncbi:uncharacterized protein LOC128679322 isoform X2 [Plodia interpunctella]|uniref:uncharacterized protein LOC128679322 isoform X2 n=1 Tax=Plodia interpunctella TaxID=58824 RepID=UPI002368C07C|nr:uncharacterized protein LOC128679322 isoform X2 [Plodia interpunctella]
MEIYDHLGRLMFDSLKQWPDGICQIDASTGEKETNSSVLSRSVQLANCFRRFGLQPGDVLSLSGKNHLDIHIPYYAALFNGLPIAGVDPTFKYDEIKTLLKLTEAKIAFCQPELYEDYAAAASDLGLELRIVTFGEGDHSLKNFIQEFDCQNGREFEPANIDIEKTFAWLVCTSGTTGRPKLAAFRHDTIVQKIATVLELTRHVTSLEYKVSLNLAPVQWISSYINTILSPITKHTRVQTSAASTPEHVIDIINKYKPRTVLTSPALLMNILSLEREKPCDFTCFDSICITGSKVPADLIVELRRSHADSVVMELHGQTETMGVVLWPSPAAPLGSCGRLVPSCQVQLVNADTGEVIHKPYEHAELWCKGLRFTEYYKNPEETAKAISEDGWYRTGDIFYKDENENFYFVERLKLLIKYRNYHVIPVELEEVIRTHANVADVCVTSVYDACDGEHPAACVVRKPGCDVTAAEIKELIASKLSDSKQLRGGVVFLDELPYTTTGKVARARLKSLIQEAHRE